MLVIFSFPSVWILASVVKDTYNSSIWKAKREKLPQIQGQPDLWIKPPRKKETFGVKPCLVTYDQTSLRLTAALVHIFEKPLEWILPCHWQDNLNPPKLQGKMRVNLHPAPTCLVGSQRIVTGLSCSPLPQPATQRITILCNLKRSVMVFSSSLSFILLIYLYVVDTRKFLGVSRL